MATVSHNTITDGLSGTIAGQVFRAYRGRNGRTRTVIGRSPTFSGEWSQEQALHRQRFRAASRYAESVKADPIRLEHYRKVAKRKATTWRAIAIRDWFQHQKSAAAALKSPESQGIL